MRLFIALDIDRGALEGIRPVLELLSNHPSIFKIVEPGTFHITLKFLGECSIGLAGDLARGFTSLEGFGEAIKYELRGLGVFPDLHRAQVIWCGIESDESRMGDIFNHIERFAGEYEFPPEKRSFQPHLTLARVRRGMAVTSQILDFLREHSATDYGQSGFRHITLYSSKLSPQGPFYEVLGRISLP